MKKIIVGKNSAGSGSIILLIFFIIILVIIVYVISFIFMFLASIGAITGGYFSLKNYFKSFKKNVVDSYRKYVLISVVK